MASINVKFSYISVCHNGDRFNGPTAAEHQQRRTPQDAHLRGAQPRLPPGLRE